MRYVMGLDIGVASIGWAVRNLDKDRIEDLGVRIFEKGEADKGKPINAQRREARGARRTLRRKAARMKKIKELFVKYKLVNVEDLENLYRKHPNEMSPWKLRFEALNRIVNGEELAVILTHLAKRRGFKSNAKVSKDEEEAGKVTKAINSNKQYMILKGYRTIGEMFFKDDKFKEHKRNKGEKLKQEGYICSVSRELIEEEIKIIFNNQRNFGNKLASEDFEKEYLDTVLFQLPFSNEELILKMVGKCTFEEEKRAPKHSLTVERANLLDNINKMTIYSLGSGRRFLTKAERDKVLDLCYKAKEVKYSHLRKLLQLSDEDRFPALTYSSKKNVENSKFVTLRGYHDILAKLEDKSLINNFELMDKVVETLTLIKDEDKIINRLLDLGLSNQEAVNLSKLNFINFSNLSLKAIKKILPFLEDGKLYYEACNLAGYNFNNPKQLVKEKLLPRINKEDIKNPVIIRALTQSRKVINAIIRKYGSPASVHIEVARDLKRSYEDRIKIKRQQEERKSNKDKLREHLREERHIENITAKAFEKYMLAADQNFICAYSQQALNVDNLLNDPTYCQIDHIIPYSQSFDDSLSNKVVVLTEENQNKGNRIPYDYFKALGRDWDNYKVFVKSLSHLEKEKQSNLLKYRFTKEEMEEFKNRNLNDTKGIARYLKNFIESTLIINKEEKRREVLTIPGRLTDTLRHRWGLKKERKDNHLHHAMDACVIACIDEKLVKRIAEYSMNHEIQFVKGEFINPETGEIISMVDQDLLSEKFPKPWMHFREEVMARLSSNPLEEIRNIRVDFYDSEFIKRIEEPILVSKMPKTKLKGQFHDATIRPTSKNTLGKIQVVIPLNKLTLEELDNFCEKDKKSELYSLLKLKLIEYNGDAVEAFSEPFRYIPTGKNKEVNIEEIKVFRDPINKVMVRKGTADIGQCIRVDVFRSEEKYYFRNVYGIDIVSNKLSDIAKGSSYVYLTDDYKFCFSLYKDNLIAINHDGTEKFGYFEFFESDGRINITSTISEEKIDRISVGKIQEIKKFEVDLLGNYSEVKKETMQNHYKVNKGKEKNVV